MHQVIRGFSANQLKSNNSPKRAKIPMCNKEAMVAHFWNKEETNLVSSDTLMKICQPKGRRMKTGCIEETGTRPEDALFKRSSEVKEARSKLFPEGRGIKGPEKPGNEFPRNVRLQFHDGRRGRVIGAGIMAGRENAH
ncbi:uncharacterized protein LOC143174564 isoform X2 [Nomia melanderi]|uniref:uncharacterized protein LOC143174564 isoform X2 n=1 Tax=Nomia melanderi TaxID=2448451 RepID=UPI003FCEE427